MAYNEVELNPGSGGEKIAVDRISSRDHQRIKIGHGAEGTATDVSAASPLPISDPWLDHAIAIISADYGDTVTMQAKNKDLLKFGRNEVVGTTEATIMHQPSGILEETFVSTNIINSIISTSTGDTQEVVIEGHTISGGVFTFVTQTATLTGQTVVALGTALARVSRVYNNGSTELVGVVSVTETDTYTVGVPDTGTKVHIQLGAGEQQSEKAATTISSVDYYIVMGFYGDVLKKTAATAEIHMEMRLAGKVFREVAMKSASNNHSAVHKFKPYLIVPKNSDIRISAIADSANTDISGGMQGVLVTIV